jgi:hypothetical protein
MWFAGRRWAVLSRSLRAARCCAQDDSVVSLHLPEGEQPNQPTSLAETAANSGSAQKLTRISRSPHWTPLASSGITRFRIGPSAIMCSTPRRSESLTGWNSKRRASQRIVRDTRHAR